MNEPGFEYKNEMKLQFLGEKDGDKQSKCRLMMKLNGFVINELINRSSLVLIVTCTTMYMYFIISRRKEEKNLPLDLRLLFVKV